MGAVLEGQASCLSKNERQHACPTTARNAAQNVRNRVIRNNGLARLSLVTDRIAGRVPSRSPDVGDWGQIPDLRSLFDVREEVTIFSLTIICVSGGCFR